MAKKKAAKKRPGKGGARAGAGRPRKNIGGSVKVSLNLPVEVVQFASESGLSLSEAISQAVKESPQFRIWHGENKTIFESLEG